MSESGPKIEERRVTEKELKSMLRHIHEFHVFFWILIFCKNNVNSKHLFL